MSKMGWSIGRTMQIFWITVNIRECWSSLKMYIQSKKDPFIFPTILRNTAEAWKLTTYNYFKYARANG